MSQPLLLRAVFGQLQEGQGEWAHFRGQPCSIHTKGKAQDDHAQLNGQQEEAGDLPQDLGTERYRVNWQWALLSQASLSLSNRTRVQRAHHSFH